MRQIDIEIKSGTHTRGDPYPTHEFTELHGFSPKSGIICSSNEEIRKYLDYVYEDPDKIESKYFYWMCRESDFDEDIQ